MLKGWQICFSRFCSDLQHCPGAAAAESLLRLLLLLLPLQPPE
jgi:hypothetical protein